MRCEDISKNLNSDTGDLDGVLKHLEICPACAEKYAADMELETALRNLSLTSETVDVTENLKLALYQHYRRQSIYSLVRKWVWIAASVATAFLLFISLPTIIEWLNYGFLSFMNVLKTIEFSNNINLRQLADKAESSKYYGYILISVFGFFIGISACLWREIKELIA